MISNLIAMACSMALSMPVSADAFEVEPSPAAIEITYTANDKGTFDDLGDELLQSSKPRKHASSTTHEGGIAQEAEAAMSVSGNLNHEHDGAYEIAMELGQSILSPISRIFG